MKVREKVADEIASNRAIYEADIEVLIMEGLDYGRKSKGDPFEKYVALLRRPGFLGDAVSIAAFSRTFGAPVRVFVSDPSKKEGFSSILFENYERKQMGEKRIAWLQALPGSGMSFEGLNHYVSVEGGPGGEEIGTAKL